MDNVSVNKANCLYWLGRYSERAYKISQLVVEFYDKMVDLNSTAYDEFCARLGLDYKFNNKEEFLKTLITDKECTSSIAYSLSMAYDNSIILREQIDTETVAYIQLACNNVMRMFNESLRIFDLQKVIDNLMSFWGAVDDYIIEDSVRDAIKAGKYVERLDLFQRFGREAYKINGCKRRLGRYIQHLDTENTCTNIKELLSPDTAHDFKEIESCINRLLK